MKQPYTIEEIAAIISPIAKAYGVKTVWLFGSCARGEATEDSDVDLLIDGGRIRTLYQLASLRLDLEDALHRPVDLLTTGGVNPEFLQSLKKDEVILYDAA